MDKIGTDGDWKKLAKLNERIHHAIKMLIVTDANVSMEFEKLERKLNCLPEARIPLGSEEVLDLVASIMMEPLVEALRESRKNFV